jgi:hypothetical protein
MENLLLTEEINKIKKLSGAINEQPTISAKVISSLANVYKLAKVPKEILKKNVGIGKLIKDGKITIDSADIITNINWVNMTSGEIALIFREFPDIRKNFDKFLKDNNVTIDILSKFSKGKYKNLVDGYKMESQSMYGAFKSGYKAPGSGGMFAKHVASYVPVIKKFTPNSWRTISSDDLKKMYGWLFTGIGDYAIIKETFQKYGTINAAINAGGQIFRKWVYWSGALIIYNIVLDIIGDLFDDEPVYGNDWEAVKERVVNNFELAGFHYVFPIAIIWKNVISPLLAGGSLGDLKEKIGIKKKEAEDKIEELAGDETILDTTPAGEKPSTGGTTPKPAGETPPAGDTTPKPARETPSTGGSTSTKKPEGTKTNVITKSGNNKVIYGSDAIIF